MDAVRATLQQVAQRAGVSRTTASYVMTGRQDMRISAAAQERVTQAAKELDYRPSLVARALRNHESGTIGWISDLLAYENFGSEAVRGSLTTALLHQHLLFVGETQGDHGLESRLVQDMLDRGVSGFVYASLGAASVSLPPVLRNQRVVLLNCRASGPDVSAVLPDDAAGGVAAVRLLLDAGHRRGIYVVGETSTALAGIERRRGIDRAMAEAGLELGGELDCIWWPDSAYRAVRELLTTGARPTALLCLNERLAIGALQAITEMGRSVPGDLSMVSFDGSDVCTWLQPHVSSVVVPHFELGRRAVEVLLGGEPHAAVHRIRMPVIERESIGPPP